MHHRLVVQSLDGEIERLHEIRAGESMQPPLTIEILAAPSVDGTGLLVSGCTLGEAYSHGARPRGDLVELASGRAAYHRLGCAVDKCSEIACRMHPALKLEE